MKKLVDVAGKEYAYVHLPIDWPCGLGTAISFYSFLWLYKRLKNTHVVYLCLNGENGSKRLFETLKEILNINWIQIISYPTDWADQAIEMYGEPVKIGDFINTVNIGTWKIDGRPRDPNRRSYNLVALCTYAGLKEEQLLTEKQVKADPDLASQYPYIKYSTEEEYTKVFWWLKSMGYDVVTLDSRQTTLKEKVEVLEKCHFAIGYEGGIAHLCHSLKIPFIMKRWRKDFTSDLFCEMLHMDKSTWFVDQFSDVMMDEDKFQKLIVDLYHGRGNNKLFREDHLRYFDVENRTMLVKHEGQTVGSISRCFSESEMEMVMEIFNTKKRIIELK